MCWAPWEVGAGWLPGILWSPGWDLGPHDLAKVSACVCSLQDTDAPLHLFKWQKMGSWLWEDWTFHPLESRSIRRDSRFLTRLFSYHATGRTPWGWPWNGSMVSVGGDPRGRHIQHKFCASSHPCFYFVSFRKRQFLTLTQLLKMLQRLAQWCLLEKCCQSNVSSTWCHVARKPVFAAFWFWSCVASFFCSFLQLL